MLDMGYIVMRILCTMQTITFLILICFTVFLLQANVKVDKNNLILVFSKGVLHAISGLDGEVVWEKDFAAERYHIFGCQKTAF